MPPGLGAISDVPSGVMTSFIEVRSGWHITQAQLATSNVNTRAGRLTALKAGVTYQASAFPIPLRITPRDTTWNPIKVS